MRSLRKEQTNSYQDVQVTKDGVVVINHVCTFFHSKVVRSYILTKIQDPTTGRVYDKDLIVADSNLDELKDLTNKSDPSQKFLTFQELAEWVITQRDGLKIMLDIKPYNNKLILVKIIRDLKNVYNDLKFWYDKIIFGLWRLDFYEYGVVTGLIKNFEIINISISPVISNTLIEYSQTVPKGFKLNAISILDVSSWANDFDNYRETVLKPNNIGLYLWTVNSPDDIKKSLAIKVDGMVTDDPVQVIAEIRLFQQKGVLYEKPKPFTLKNLKIQTLFFLFRVFEFVVVNQLTGYRVVQFVLSTFAKFVLNH